jgi:heme exporter protein D
MSWSAVSDHDRFVKQNYVNALSQSKKLLKEVNTKRQIKMRQAHTNESVL